MRSGPTWTGAAPPGPAGGERATNELGPADQPDHDGRPGSRPDPTDGSRTTRDLVAGGRPGGPPQLRARAKRRQVVAVVGLVAFGLRLPALGRPSVLVFDEIFYAPDAADLIRWGSEHGQPAHPPLGKWLIGSGIATLGFDPVGWRIAAVVAGAAMCAVVAWAAIRLTGRIDLGLAAGLLVALDGLVHVTSRLALLDGFLALFTTAAVAALVGAWTAQPDWRRARRCWWVAVGAMALGTAVKPSALSLVPLVIVVGWVLAGRLVAPGRPRRRRRLVTVAAALVLPVVAVVGATLPRQLGPDRTNVGGYLDEQAAVARFHRDLRPTNPNAATAWTWAIQTHPASLYRATCPLRAAPSTRTPRGPGDTATTCGRQASVARIVAGANPVVWLLGLVGLAAALIGALRGRELAALLTAALASLWVPFLASPRASYSFYAVALVGPMVLAAAWAAALVRVATRSRPPGWRPRGCLRRGDGGIGRGDPVVGHLVGPRLAVPEAVLVATARVRVPPGCSCHGSLFPSHRTDR